MTSKSQKNEFVGKQQVVTVKLQPAELGAIDAWRQQQDNKPSRADALVQLAAKALTNKGAH